MKRRDFLSALTATVAGLAIEHGLAQPVFAQPSPAPNQPRFAYDDVVRRARDLAAAPFEPNEQPIPEQLAKLDFDAFRDIRFRADKSFLLNGGGPFGMQLFHPGYSFTRTVTINIVRDGVAAPIPYVGNLFDYGRTKIEKPLPPDTGFAGFRLHYPLLDARSSDEIISFLGASYFRFLSRDQQYGLSARGVTINAGLTDAKEEFPFFKEFWVEMPKPNAERITMYALLDGDSLSGAYMFVLAPGEDTTIDVTATLFPRKLTPRLGIAPLTSMFFYGENELDIKKDYRPELHDSDGLLMQTSTGEWIWRPLHNPTGVDASIFSDVNFKGFGLWQRDRQFDHYQDLDLLYEKRPSYWVEPLEPFGEGTVELFELHTVDETFDNIVCYWSPKVKIEPGQSRSFKYRITSYSDPDHVMPRAYALNTFHTVARALGSSEAQVSGSRRFIIDFTGGDLAYYLPKPDAVQIVCSTTVGKVTPAFIVANPDLKGFRAAVDLVLPIGEIADVRVYLKAGNKTLSETWTVPWRGQ